MTSFPKTIYMIATLIQHQEHVFIMVAVIRSSGQGSKVEKSARDYTSTAQNTAQRTNSSSLSLIKIIGTGAVIKTT